jgi:hypothetical protein
VVSKTKTVLLKGVPVEDWELLKQHGDLYRYGAKVGSKPSASEIVRRLIKKEANKLRKLKEEQQ